MRSIGILLLSGLFSLILLPTAEAQLYPGFQRQFNPNFVSSDEDLTCAQFQSIFTCVTTIGRVEPSEIQTAVDTLTVPNGLAERIKGALVLAPFFALGASGPGMQEVFEKVRLNEPMPTSVAGKYAAIFGERPPGALVNVAVDAKYTTSYGLELQASHSNLFISADVNGPLDILRTVNSAVIIDPQNGIYLSNTNADNRLANMGVFTARLLARAVVFSNP